MMHQMRWMKAMWAAATCAAVASAAHGQTTRPAAGRGGPATRPAPAATQPAETEADAQAPLPSSEQVMREMNREIESRPLIAPRTTPATGSAVESGGSRSGTQADSADPAGESAGRDPASATGAAPGSLSDGQSPGRKPSKLRREGEFIVNRIGRLLRSGSGTRQVFSFDADAKGAPDPPVVLLPSAALQAMEDEMRERGDRVRFEVSGQITTYRGANYLMVTRWAVPPDRENLQR